MRDALPIVAVVTNDNRGDVEANAGIEVSTRRVRWIDDTGRPLSPAALQSQVEQHGALAACFGLDVPIDLALSVANLLEAAAFPTGAVLVREPSPDLWREALRSGVRDIISPNSMGLELGRALLAEAERVARIRSVRVEDIAVSNQRSGRIIVTLSPKGGSGKTMLSTNLAVALAMGLGSDVALVDLDCVFGDCASVLGMVPEHTIGQLASMPSFDSTTIKVFLTRHEPSGLFVLAGAGSPEEGEAVTGEIASQILGSLSRDVGHIVVDTAAGLDERALAAIDMATDLVLVASLDVTSIRNLGKEVDALDRMGATAARRHFVINRADARVGLEISDVESAIGMTLDAALPSSRDIPLSMNQGTVIALSQPDSQLGRQLHAFARQFMVDESTDAIERRNRFFKWRTQ